MFHSDTNKAGASNVTPLAVGHDFSKEASAFLSTTRHERRAFVPVGPRSWRPEINGGTTTNLSPFQGARGGDIPSHGNMVCSEVPYRSQA